eukprot:7015192-Pyramimonas_sp.AAC.1
MGTRIAIFGVHGPHWRLPVVENLVSTQVLHVSRRRACRKLLVLPAPGPRCSAVAFAALTGERIPSQLCRCPINFVEH